MQGIKAVAQPPGNFHAAFRVYKHKRQSKNRKALSIEGNSHKSYVRCIKEHYQKINSDDGSENFRFSSAQKVHEHH